MAMQRIVKGDTVDDPPRQRKRQARHVKAVFPKAGMATVEGLNIVKRHTKQGTQQQNMGGSRRPAASSRRKRRFRSRRCSTSARSARRRRACAAHARPTARASRLRQVRRARARLGEGSVIMAARLKEKYDRPKSASKLQERFGYKNVNQIPKLEKVVINMSVGDAISNSKALDAAVDELHDDQRPEADHHQGEEVDRGVQAARRHEHRRQGDAARRADVRVPRQAVQRRAAAYPRLPRAAAQVVRRPRQLQLGLREQIVFPEINYDKVDKTRGMDIVIVTTRQDRRRSDGVPHRNGAAAAERQAHANG